MKKKAVTRASEMYAIIANERYGLYVGIVDEYNVTTRVVRAREVRHVARWYGRTGGITSLAVYGLCGPEAAQSRIGAPVVSATLTGIVNVFECTKIARSTFENSVQS